VREVVRRASERFALPGKVVEVAPHGSGHIHETFAVSCEQGGCRRRFVVQRLNTAIFRDPDALMGNLVRIARHLRAALARSGAPDPERRHLAPVPTRDGATHHVDEEGGVWRAFPRVEGARSHDLVDGPAQAREAARAFGAFVAVLADLPPPPLAETIPRFHDLASRCAALEAASRADPVGRVRAAAPELASARALAERLERALAPTPLAALPRRTVHNDCKLNNLLLDDVTGEGLCVIDLDTVMEGSVLFDFGELVRTGSCAAPEDEVRLERVRVDRELLDALAAGFAAGADSLLDAGELAALPLAGPLMALENGVRFLADHLEGDRYFRIHRSGHNLDRARVQLRLAERLLAEEAALRRSLERAARAR
jgi:Ser/Thr protein kinase RdoA (MazF antagonist)